MSPTERVELLPILETNYVFVLVDTAHKQAVVVDPGEAQPASAFLRENGLTPLGILITHHHQDHIGGALELKNEFHCPVYAPRKNQRQIPFADSYVAEGDHLKIGNWAFSVLEMPGHTLGHVAYFEARKKWLFSGDVIFGLGCGRLFEGSYEEAYNSLQRIKQLPADSLIYCTHEYTERNLEFCRLLRPHDNTPICGDSEALDIYANELINKRSLHLPSVPLKLAIEEHTNPFLLAENLAQFTYLRDLRNRQ